MIFRTCLKISSEISGHCFDRQLTVKPDFGVSCWSVLRRFASSLALPKTATILQDDDAAKVVVLGTTHVSKNSVEDVAKVARHLQPNAILVELCHKRKQMLKLTENNFDDSLKFDIPKLWRAIEDQGFPTVFIGAILSRDYVRTAKRNGTVPGGEFSRAYQEMQKIPDCKLYLGDRPVNITVERIKRKMSLLDLGKAFYYPYQELKKIDAESEAELIEKLKDRKLMKPFYEKLEREVPAVKMFMSVIRDERDKYLAYSLQECVREAKKGARVLAVVGAAHVDGIAKYYGKMKHRDIVPLLMVPPSSLISKIWKTTFCFLVFAFMYRLFFGQ